MVDGKPTQIRVALPWAERHPKTILVITTLVCLLPFAGKAIHIDDPLFVWAGQHMRNRWLDPYGFDVNWYGWTMPFHQVTKNPPLACGFLALIISVFGNTEWVLHLGFFAQAIAAILGTYVLARRLCNHPTQAALATLFTPVFMLSSTTLMCDVLMIALWIWAVVFWIRGLDENRPALLGLAGFLIGACSLAKYFGLALIPLLLVYSLLRKERSGRLLAYLLMPVVLIAFYEWVMWSSYGHCLVQDAFGYASERHSYAVGVILFKVLAGLSFAGGCCAIVIISIPILWRPKGWPFALIVLPLLLLSAWVLSGSLPANTGIFNHFGITLWWTLLILGGLVILGLPIFDWKRRKSPDAVLLLLWIWGTFAFCIFNWSINGRSVLPMVPAVAILLLRQIESNATTKNHRVSWALGAAALLSLVVSFSDYHLANSARRAVAEIKTKFGNDSATTIWFQGHWGFQYYAQEKGWRPLDFKHLETQTGDLLVFPVNNTNLKPIPKDLIDTVWSVEIPGWPLIATMSNALGAGFYMDIYGPFPFSFGVVPPEKYFIIKLK